MQRENCQLLPAASNRSVDLLEIVGRHLATAAVGDELELDLLPFDQLTETGTLDSTDMDEGVLAAAIGLNEAEALGCVEPLHGSRSHGKSFSQRRYASPPK